MKRIATPMFGGLFYSFALEWIVYPALYFIWKPPTMTTAVEIYY